MTDEERPPRPLSGKGVLLRCSWCRKEMRLDLGSVYDKAGAELYLHLITGGWFGDPQGLEFRKTQPDDFPGAAPNQIGMSACCGKQIEGELYGY